MVTSAEWRLGRCGLLIEGPLFDYLEKPYDNNNNSKDDLFSAVAQPRLTKRALYMSLTTIIRYF